MFNIFNKNKLSKEEKQFNQQFSSGADDIILSKNLRKDLNNKNLNNNICVIGQAGTGKGRSFIMPNLLQANSNFVIFEGHAHEHAQIAKFLEQQKGYNIQIFDLQNIENSLHYNPFDFINNEGDINRLLDCLYDNIESNGDFFDKMEKMFIKLSIFFLMEKNEKVTFSNIYNFLENTSASNTRDFYKIFEEIEKTNPKSKCAYLAKTIKQVAEKRRTSSLMDAANRIHPFTNHFGKILNDTNLDINALIDSKAALFIIAPVFKEPLHPIIAMLYSEIFKQLNQYVKEKGRLPYHVQFIMDEFANMCYLREFDYLIAGSRHRNMDFTLLIQSISQLKAKFPDTWKIILDCCDIKIFLGASSHETLNYFCNLIKQNITINDLKTMNMSDCIVFTHKTSGILCDKYILEEHPDYQNVIKVNN